MLKKRALQIRHADATGEVEESWFIDRSMSELIDRFALYDEEHLGGANAKTFAPPRDVAAEVSNALHDSPGGQTQRQNDELFREAARANGMDELERDPEKEKKLLSSIPSLILRVVIIALVALMVCDMALLVLSYSSTDVAALREVVDEPLDQVFEALSVVLGIFLVLMGVFQAVWGSLEPLVAQRLYLGRGRLMLVSSMSRGRVCYTEGSNNPPCITSIGSYEVRKRCIVVRGNLCRAAATVEGRHFSLTGEERLDELKIWRVFSEEDELRLLGMLDQMVSTSQTPQERGADTPFSTDAGTSGKRSRSTVGDIPERLKYYDEEYLGGAAGAAQSAVTDAFKNSTAPEKAKRRSELILVQTAFKARMRELKVTPSKRKRRMTLVMGVKVLVATLLAFLGTYCVMFLASGMDFTLVNALLWLVVCIVFGILVVVLSSRMGFNLNELTYQRLYLGSGGFMFSPDVGKRNVKLYLLGDVAGEGGATRIEGFEVKKDRIVVRGSFCRAELHEGDEEISISEGGRRARKLRIWRIFSEDDERRLLDELGQMTSGDVVDDADDDGSDADRPW